MPLLLGNMLVKAGVISEQQLEEAIQAQVIFGGKLGTNLIDLGLVNIATLGRFLSRKHNVPTIDHLRLKPCPREVRKIFGKKLAVKHQAIPLAIEGTRLDVLMANPSDVAAIDEIGFATGKRVKPYVAPELVVMALMEKYYGVQRDVRYVQLSIRDTQSLQRDHDRPTGIHAPPADDHKIAVSPKAPERVEIKGLEFGKQEELTSETQFQEMVDTYHTSAKEKAPAPKAKPPPPPPTAKAKPPPPQAKISTPPPPEEEEVMDLEELVLEAPAWSVDEPGMEAIKEDVIEEEEEEEELELLEELPEALTLAEATERLKGVKDRDDLSQVVLAFALSNFKRAALFITRGGMALGWDGMGGTINSRAVQGIMLPLNAPSIFKTVYDSSAFFLGPVPKAQLNDRFLKLMGGERPHSVFLIPILFRGQVVNILYGDNGHEQNAPTDISDLLILAPKVPQAFEELILRKKQEAQGKAQ